MGGALIALSEDAGAIYHNPARLSYLEVSSVTVDYARLVEGVTSDFVKISAAKVIGEDITAPLQKGSTHKAAFGVALQFMGLDLSQGSRYSEFGATFSGSWAPANFASLGGNLRYQRADTDLSEVSASTLAADFGTSIALFPTIEVALMFRNLIGATTFSSGASSEDLVRQIVFGVAYTRSGRIAGEVDFIAESQSTYILEAGVEVSVAKPLALRAGLKQWIDPGSRSVPALGLGLELSKLTFDYGVQIDEQESIGVTHRFTLGGRF
jgi:hypothetical protein